MEVANIERLRINESIRAKQVRLIDEKGEQLGIKSTAEALKIASEKRLDLVEVAPKIDPPVCKIIDFDKYKYEQARKIKQQRKSQKVGQMKEIWIKPRIGEHDLEFKIAHICDFVKDKHKVKVSILFLGREMQHRERGYEIINKVKEKIADIGVIEGNPRFQGKRLAMMVSPKKIVGEDKNAKT
jgi:translation initiation factor IF-3